MSDIKLTQCRRAEIINALGAIEQVGVLYHRQDNYLTVIAKLEQIPASTTRQLKRWRNSSHHVGTT